MILLIVANQPSPNTRHLAEAVRNGALKALQELQSEALTPPPEGSRVEVKLCQPLEAHAEDVRTASGVILGTTENFGSISGLMKDFLERIYYPCLEHTQGKPYALYVRAGNDGQGTVAQSERIITGLRWKAIQPSLILRGDFDEAFTDRCNQLGQLMAAGLDAGIF